jgi:hypothetical protein
MMEKIVTRLTQNSTWRGIILVVTAISAGLQPEHATTLLTTGVGLVGAINIVRSN